MIWVLEAPDGFTYIVKGVEKKGIKQAVSEKKKEAQAKEQEHDK